MAQHLDFDEPLMTVSELAVWSGKSEAWIYRRSRSGELPTIMIGRSRRFSRAAIQEWLSSTTGDDLTRPIDINESS